MKVFTSVLAIAMAVASVSAVAIEPMSNLEARCLANGKACKANGSLGNCCSGFCLAQGSKTGKCAKKSFAVAEESAAEETAAEEESEPVAQIEARCLANGKKCKANGSMGSCCSGFCLAQGNKVGVCKKH